MAVVGVLEEEVLVQAVARKGDRRNAEAREGVLVPVPPAEATCVAPRLAGFGSRGFWLDRGRGGLNRRGYKSHVRPLPRIVARLAGRGQELAHVEARDVGLRLAAGAQYSGTGKRAMLAGVGGGGGGLGRGYFSPGGLHCGAGNCSSWCRAAARRRVAELSQCNDERSQHRRSSGVVV